MVILDEYLEYLNSGQPLSEIPSFSKIVNPLLKSAGKITKGKGFSTVAKYHKGALKTALVWTVGIKAASMAFGVGRSMISDAHRKCGTAFSNSPGKRACVAKEKIKGYQKQIAALNSMRNQCNKSKDPAECQNKIDNKLQRAKIFMSMNQDKLNSLSEGFAGVAKFAKGTGSFIYGGIILSILVDKVMFATWRRVHALFSKVEKQCRGTKEGSERNLCVSKAKMSLLKSEKQLISQMASTCSKQKDPAKCSEKVRNKLTQINKNLEIEKYNIISYGKEMEEINTKKAMKLAKKNKTPSPSEFGFS